jgi:hypothetical protein
VLFILLGAALIRAIMSAWSQEPVSGEIH